MPSSRAADHPRPRRDPFSCQSCRVKKLKCDRQRPCSNCQTRRLSCEYVRSSPSTALPTALPTAVSPHNSNGVTENENLKTRIRRLEQAVFGDGASIALPSPEHGKDSLPTSQAKHGSTTAATDSEWLEGIGTRLTDMLPHSSSAFQVITHTMDHFESGSDQLPKANSVSIPTLDTVQAYIDSWEAYLDAMIPVMHIPSVRELSSDLYRKLETKQDVDSGAVALVLAISASVCLWQFQLASHANYSHGSARAAIVLAEHAQHALEHGRRVSKISIEAVQAMILLSFHYGHLCGFSSYARTLQSSAFTMARSIGLHRTDAPGSIHSLNAREAPVETEIKRRVWWHLACTDWLLSYIGGLHEGTYSIQPRHMAVNQPRNLTCKDLGIPNPEFRRPNDEPTTMLFFLQRMKLAVVCREVVDALLNSSVIPEPEQVSYGTILDLDAKFRSLIDDLPPSLQLRVASDDQATRLGEIYDGKVAFQRVLVNIFVHSRRCRLHLPFLIRLPADTQFAFSRQMCVESAHKILQTRRMFCSTEAFGAFAASLRLGMNLSHMFLAIIVLVMDICVNNTDEPEQLAEVHDAIRVVEEMKASSQIAANFLESLTGILQKHHVHLPPTRTANGTSNGHVPVAADANPNLSNGSQMSIGDTVFEDVWQDLLYNGPSIDPPEWDALLQDLEMQIA